MIGKNPNKSIVPAKGKTFGYWKITPPKKTGAEAPVLSHQQKLPINNCSGDCYGSAKQLQ
jgi:hypothetical protein